MARVDFMGCPIDALTMPETVARVEELIEQGGLHQHMAINAGKVVQMSADPELVRIVRGCSLVNADGASIVAASKVLGAPLPERVAGVDLFQELVGLCAAKGYRPYLLGARAEIVARVVEVFRERHPGLEVAGFRDGYFAEDEEPAVAAAVRDSAAQMLFVAIPSPFKEKFLGRWVPEMRVPFCMGVGGSFDVVAGLTKRAPGWLQRAGLEWAWRFGQEPRRMWKRYLVGNTRFLACVLKARLGGYRLPEP